MKNTYTMAELATTLGGELIGDGTHKVDRLSHPSQVSKATDLALAIDKDLMPLLSHEGVQAAIVAPGAELPVNIKAAVAVGRARLAIARLTSVFEEKIVVSAGIHSTAVIETGAIIGEDVSIGAMVSVCSGAHIGAGCVLHPQCYVGPHAFLGQDCVINSGVRIGSRVKIGARAIIHFNASIGADGFSFVTPERGSVEAAKETGSIGDASNAALVRIASLGAVELGDDVEIGANTCIDRGTIISTKIGNGTKIDNQVQIGHNVQVGENCMLCGRVGIAGSSVIGDRVVIGGASGVADHVTIGDDTVCMGMCGVSGDLPPKSLVGGVPAKPRKQFIQDMFNISRVKKLAQKVDELTKKVDGLS